MKNLVVFIVGLAALLLNGSVAVADNGLDQESQILIAANEPSPAPSAIPSAEPVTYDGKSAEQIAADKIPAPPEKPPWWFRMLTDALGQFPNINGWLIAILMLLSVVLRAVAEFMGFLAEKTAGKADDARAKMVLRLSLWTGSLLGWFGGGSPKRIARAKEASK